MMMKKPIAVGTFFMAHLFWEGIIPFSKEKTPILQENNPAFHKRDIIFYLFAIFSGGGGRELRTLERHLPTQK